MPTALVSVSDKEGLVTFAQKLRDVKGYDFVATGSTAQHLKDNGVECVTVDSVTEFPEILGGRVKTLHPKIFGGILAKGSKEDKETLKQMGIPEIDMVICNLYQFEKKLEEGLGESEMIEHIDIGGVTLLRAAAKNFDRVSIVSDPAQYDEVLAAIESSDEEAKPDKTFRRKLAQIAFQRTNEYDSAISAYFAKNISKDAGVSSNGNSKAFPPKLDVSLAVHRSLRYGENPHQSAIWYAPSMTPGLPGSRGLDCGEKFPPFDQLQGKEMSTNNIVDTFALVRFLRELKKLGKPGVCIIKHNNPCGIAIGKDMKEAFDKALSTDPISAFGGIFGFTGEVDEDIATEATQGFIEIIAAPSFTDGAQKVLRKKKNVRVLILRDGVLDTRDHDMWHARHLQDFGWIVEKSDDPPVDYEAFECASGSAHGVDSTDVMFAWSVVKHLTSNAIFIAKDGKSLGFGIGQTSRIASVKIALEQAGDAAKGAILASDAFFPATDNIEAAAKAGISLIVQPGGSIKDKEVIDACKDSGITMLLTGQRCFKH